MSRWLTLVALALASASAPVHAAGISGHYIEARNCDVWTGPCFANAEMNLTGKHAVMAWKVNEGCFENVRLDGLSIVAVIAASDTLGLQQTGPSRAVLIVDDKADSAQRSALIHLAQKQGGKLVNKIVAVQSAKVDLAVNCCKEGGCARLDAGKARIQTRCINSRHDKICGNESAFYPPLSENVKAEPAVAVEHSFAGQGFNETWKDTERRGAYVGSFEIR
ncbi:MAG TPA: DUF1326 domain-containing protein [Gemmataceae bacterium]|nr:DUF1326 domain-containing protein [Gemmataceae bacterium]